MKRWRKNMKDKAAEEAEDDDNSETPPVQKVSRKRKLDETFEEFGQLLDDLASAGLEEEEEPKQKEMKKETHANVQPPLSVFICYGGSADMDLKNCQVYQIKLDETV